MPGSLSGLIRDYECDLAFSLLSCLSANVEAYERRRTIGFLSSFGIARHKSTSCSVWAFSTAVPRLPAFSGQGGAVLEGPAIYRDIGRCAGLQKGLSSVSRRKSQATA